MSFFRVPPFFPKLLSSLIIALVAFLAFENLGTIASWHIFGTLFQGPLAILILGAFLLGSVCSVFTMLNPLNQLQQKLKQQELRKEKAEVGQDAASDKIFALENKIKTLEVALEKALLK